MNHLEQLAAAVAINTQSKAEVALHVREARVEGRTWKEIAAVLGISPQAAHERFSKGEVRTVAYDDP